MYADTAHRANPEDAPLLLGDFARRLGFGSIALPAFVLLKPCLRNHEGAVFELTDDIGKVDMRMALKQVVDGERDWQGGSELVGRSKCGANISASIPGHLRMVFQVFLLVAVNILKISHMEQKRAVFSICFEHPQGSALPGHSVRTPMR